MLELVLGLDPEPAQLPDQLEADAFVRRAERHDLVDRLIRGIGASGEPGVGPLDRVAHDQTAHGVGDDVDLERAVAMCGIGALLDLQERLDELDQTDQRLAVDREGAVVQVVVAEHPHGAERITLRLEEARRHAGVDHHFVPGEEVRIEIGEVLGNGLGVGHRIGKVADHVGGVVVLPAVLEQTQNEPFVDVVLAALLRIHAAVVEALIGDRFLVLDGETAEAADQNDRQMAPGRRRPAGIRHRQFP